ncbi:S8 family serine peptidase [Marilutibacter alkalisoli]|uniref:S8 family serine peptidase n=1 Tax=Marilutibacter alkalisoli TaxID=2591633 RepID=A0A514BRH9_9GAMM|nr:S8 family serine peptidase [Lysobacter alkalisoli]QDH69976.1 S8 family serine peptidase [Lysobacter alkalisoli]
MKHNSLALAIGLGIGLVFAAGTGQAADGPDQNRVWVKFKPDSKAQVNRALQVAGGKIHHTFDGATAVTLPPSALQGIRNNPHVELVEQDVPRYSMAQTQPYGIGMVQAPQVWADGVTGDGVTVCVIDSGIHAAHEDFQGVNLAGGYPSGWNTDTCGHGSHVAGTIAAADNNAGVVGVNTGNISLYIVKVFDGASCGWSYSSTLVDAANRCANAGAKVINMSLGGSFSSTTERNAFQNLYDNGVLSIAAAGNAGNTSHSYPASYDSVVSVAAVDSNKQHASFSQRTNQVELAAPGVSVLSTVPHVSATASVDGSSYIVSSLEYTYQGQASGALVNGGLCTSSGSWAGKAVLCERGDISFADKVNNAYNGGAAAVVIYNNAPGGFSGTLGSAGPAIPAVSMTQEDGQYLVANKLGSSATVNTIPDNQGNGYAFYDGTSMATPHVAGVAALVWSANPTWTNQEVREALAVTAEDLGTAGRDNSYGWGLVQAKAALDELQNGGGGTDPDPDPDPDPNFTVSGSSYKVKGVVHVDLSWSGSSAGSFDVFRDGSKVATTGGSSYTDNTGRRGGGSLTYSICEAGTSTCTATITVSY